MLVIMILLFLLFTQSRTEGFQPVCDYYCQRSCFELEMARRKEKYGYY